MIMLGAYVALAKPVSMASIKDSMFEVLPERNHAFIPLNHSALDRGAEVAGQLA